MFSTVCFAVNNEEIIRLTKHKVPVMNHFAFRGICYTIGGIISHCIVQCNYLPPDIKPLVSSVFVSRTYSTEVVLSSFLPFHDQDAATTVSRELTIFSLVLNWNYTSWVIVDAHLISSNSKRELLDFTTVLLTLLGHLSSFPLFNGVHVARSLVFFVVFCGSLSFDLWPLTIVLFPSIYSFSWISRGQHDWHTCCCKCKLAVRIELLPMLLWKGNGEDMVIHSTKSTLTTPNSKRATLAYDIFWA